MLSLPQSEASTTAQTDNQDEKSKQQSAGFTAAVLDMDAATAKRAVRDCAVFIVPQVPTLHACATHTLASTHLRACDTYSRAIVADTAPVFPAAACDGLKEFKDDCHAPSGTKLY